MAAVTLDLSLNEGETFIMAIEFWEDDDGTIPADITNNSFDGAFKIGQKYIPMTIIVKDASTNVIEATISYDLMVDLELAGRYDIEMLQDGEKFRIIQGAVRISKEVTGAL